MASPDVIAHGPDRHTRRRPFTSWVRRLTNLKSTDLHNGKKGSHHFMTKKVNSGRNKNNPYPESGHMQSRPRDVELGSVNGNLSFSERASRPTSSSIHSAPASDVANGTIARSNRSAAPTVATNPETIHSDAGQSKAFTSKTGGALSSIDGVGVSSNFSSPNQSEHSLTTTLTTIHSDSPGTLLGSQSHTNANPASAERSQGSVSFSNHFSPSGPASALPPHLAPMGHPSTYSTATANNLLTDDASIVTLASSSKRRRRRSMDTDASVRALAPSSVWGGSRESLPLSILSSNVDTPTGLATTQSQGQTRPGLAAERASIYSSHSVAAPALVSDRNSYYANSIKQSIKEKERDKDSRSIDGRSMHKDTDERSLHGSRSLHESIRAYEGSVRSGAISHNRKDSNPGSMTAPLAGPGQPWVRDTDSSSRRSSTLPTDGGDAASVNERKASTTERP